MKRFTTFVAFMVVVSVSVFGDPGVINQSDILSRVGNHALVTQALVSLEIKIEMLSAASGWQGASISLLPSMRYDDATGTMQLSETALGLDFNVPLGTNQAERERRLQAGELVAIAQSELDAAIGKAYLDLFSLYAAGYSAQEALTLAEKEEELARLRQDSVNQKTQRGLSSVSDQADAEAEYQAAVESRIQASLDARLAWFKLASAAGLEVARPVSGTPGAQNATLSTGVVFELPVLTQPDLDSLIRTPPLPVDLMTTAKDRSPAVLAQKQKLASATRSLENFAPLDLNITPKLSYALPAASASIGYGTASGAITLGTDWSPYAVTASSASKTQPPDHSFSVSIGLSGSINPNASAEKASLQAAVRLEELKLLALEHDIELSVRSMYAAYLKAKDSLAEADRTKRLAIEISAATQARRALGQLSPEDEAADAVLLTRASFNVEKARTSLGQAYLGMIAASNAWDLANLTINGAKQ